MRLRSKLNAPRTLKFTGDHLLFYEREMSNKFHDRGGGIPNLTAELVLV